MLPIIRRRRYPLLPSDSSETSSVEPQGVGLSSASSQNVPSPSPAPSTSIESDHPPKTENRSDFGQFWTDSVPTTCALGSTATKLGEGGADCAQDQSDPIPQPSTLPSQPIWSFQPNEPAADYQLFAAWLQLPAPRHLRQAAATLGCSLYRLRQLSRRHDWTTRADEFERHRASAASLALDQLVSNETTCWKERVLRFRIQEWLLHEEMLQTASNIVRQLQKHPRRASLNDLVNLINLASALGRRACGMPLDLGAGTESESPPSYPDFEAALRKIYGTTDFCKPAVSPESSFGDNHQPGADKNPDLQIAQKGNWVAY